MGSWIYLHMYAGGKSPLDLEAAYSAFIEKGIEFDNKFKRGLKGESGVTFRKYGLYECGGSFDSDVDDPCIVFAFSLKQFQRLDESLQDKVYIDLVEVAHQAHAGYVVVGIESGDIDEDFIKVDGIRIFDDESSRIRYLEEMWINEGFGALIPEGVKLQEGEIWIKGYKIYRIQREKLN